MGSLIDPLIDMADSFFAWMSASTKQTMESYCEIQTADDVHTLVAHDGSLLSVIRIIGSTTLVGNEEFKRFNEGFSQALEAIMSNKGHSVQVFFSYDRQNVGTYIEEIFGPARATADRLQLSLDDLYDERTRHLSSYCAKEDVFLVLWTRPSVLTVEQLKRAHKKKNKDVKDNKIPPFRNTQNLIAAIPDLRNVHDSFVRSIVNDLAILKMDNELLNCHDAIYQMRMTADPHFTARDWRPSLPGDKIFVKEQKKFNTEISDLLWPSLARQILPRDAETIDSRTTRIGETIYSSVFIDLFPQNIKPFAHLFARTLPTQIPYRLSFWIESDGLLTIKFKSILASILSFSSAQNRLISDANQILRSINVSSDNAVVRLKVTATTWAPADDIALLRTRASELAKAIQGWGSCDVSQVCGDPFGGIVSSMLAVNTKPLATPSIAPLSDVVFMLPLHRPSSPWTEGAILFRTPDGKPFPYQPGSSKQTTWIDLVYARPGSGKSVLSNATNLALCLSGGLQRLPRIAIIDIGPSSSGLISLLKEALPYDQQHLVAHHRLRMTPEYAVNPFDTQLGCRFPTPQERAFLVNFLTLLATPVGSERPYDGITDMAGMVVDELYNGFKDDTNPNNYSPGVEPLIDGILEEMGFVRDKRTTWWEVTDALFAAGFQHEAQLAQRYAMPLLADAASICRSAAIEDLYGKIIAPTGETIINAFSRMISSAVREYSILSRITNFDIGESKVVSLDLDEVAKSGGEAADRQTAVMYMLARYILARHYYLTDENVNDMPDAYKAYHSARITEIREDEKRIVYDEFHRTSKAQAVRDQVLIDMREGRKWKVQIALLSQSIDDFDEIMVEFATSIFIMDAGPEQAIAKTAKTFGLSPTAVNALRSRVHGPTRDGATFLAQFATKTGINIQLLTLTLGPIELWAFSTTAEDAAIRNKLYSRIGPDEARRVLANIFPGGSITQVVEKRLYSIKQEMGFVDENSNLSVIDELLEEIVAAYTRDPNVRSLAS